MLPASILLVLLGFTFLIVVHELGHYLAAKWAGIRVEAFAVGMGPVVASWRRGIGFAAGSTDRRVRARFGRSAMQMTDAELRTNGLGETEWSLRALPLGGFVKMLGQDDLNPETTSTGARHYMAAPVGRRMVVVSAGVIANALLAVALFMVAFLVGVRFEAPVIGEVMPGSPAAGSPGVGSSGAGSPSASATAGEPAAALADRPGSPQGLRPGDRVLSVEGDRVLTFSDIDIAVAMAGPDATLELLVERPGVSEPVRLEVKPVYEKALGRQVIGIIPARSTTLADQRDTLAAATAQLDLSGLAAQGVRPGMSLETLGDTAVQTWEMAEAEVRRSEGRAIPSRWRGPDGSLVTATIRPEPQLGLVIVPASGATEGGGRSTGSAGQRDQATFSLLGLAPLVKISFVDPASLNVGLLKPGDVIRRLSLKDDPTTALEAPRPDEIIRFVGAAKGREVEVEILRGGEPMSVLATVDRSGRLGIGLGQALDLPFISRPIDRVRRGEEVVATAAAPADLLAGARIDAIDGQPVADWREIWLAFRAAANRPETAAKGATIEVTATPSLPAAAPETVTLQLEPGDVADLRALSWRLPLGEDLFEPLSTLLSAEGNPLKAVSMGFRETHKMIVNTYLTIYGLINRTVAVDQLRGPVGIVHLGTAVIERGWPYLVFFLAMISANLAVLNFLPLPIVDGGLFLNLVYEKLRGVPPPLGFQNAATLVGLVLIAGIFLMTFYFDVMRLVG